MNEFKLTFPELDQTYSHMAMKMTEKGQVKQIIGNIVTTILNPNYCKKKKIIEGQIIMDPATETSKTIAK